MYFSRPDIARSVLRGACTALLCSATLAAHAVDAVAPAASAPDWSVVGRQGIIQVVIVPTEQMHDKDAYMQQINRLCAPGQTCFINFFTNTTHADQVLPLPDAISHEATALFRRSVKQGAEMFEWSCRMATTESLCF